MLGSLVNEAWLTTPAQPRKTERLLERVMGIEPTLEAWEAAVLPLNYTRSISC